MPWGVGFGGGGGAGGWLVSSSSFLLRAAPVFLFLRLQMAKPNILGVPLKKRFSYPPNTLSTFGPRKLATECHSLQCARQESNMTQMEAVSA